MTLRPDFNHLVSPVLEDPYPLYAELREEAPVVYNPIFNLWFVTRADDVASVMRDPVRFSSAEVLAPRYGLAPEVLKALGDDYSGVYPLLSSDPPLHTRVRSLVARAFTAQRIGRLEPRVRAIASELLDGFADDGEADLVHRFAYPLPMRLMAELLSIPARDMDMIKQWCDDETLFMMAPLELEQRVACARSVAAYRRYLFDMVQSHRQELFGDLLDDMIDARLDGGVGLTDDELVGTLCVLLFAGHETTTNMIGNTLLQLLRRPGTWQALRDDPGLIPAALEEGMRFDAPVQGMTRTVTEDVVIGGVAVPKGAHVFAVFASANRDAAQCPDPDRFEIGRTPAPTHMSFGRGPHFCIGAPLARLEGRIALELLTQRLPDARLAVDAPPPYSPNLVHRGPASLPVVWQRPNTRQP